MLFCSYTRVAQCGLGAAVDVYWLSAFKNVRRGDEG